MNKILEDTVLNYRKKISNNVYNYHLSVYTTKIRLKLKVQGLV